MCIYYIYKCNHENNVPSWLSPQIIHHVVKCMSCHKANVVITGRAHCFHDYIYLLHPSHLCEYYIYIYTNI